jgi:ribosomal-protein-alanine N-acetyltransferase
MWAGPGCDNRPVIHVRPAVADDAAPLAAVYLANRDFLAPWEPVRDDSFFTAQGQLDLLEKARASGTGLPCAIEEDGTLIGLAALSAIARGPAQSANLGYWVAEASGGRGVATEAVRQLLGYAFGELELHRVQAGTLLHNAASQRVLEHNGFERIGVARSYLRIAGRWQDHVLFQRLADS